ncbi:serine hydrolase-like protein 2 [Aphomia sociella]
MAYNVVLIISIMKKINREWFISAPWGKIAMISWGNPNGEPVLLAHGRSDSASTFVRLLELLPDHYHYVGLDFPNNGKSDPFPVGVTLSSIHNLAALEVVLKHLSWDSFIFIGHSNGCDQGLFYNVIYPGQIKKFILLDGRMSLQRLQIQDMTKYKYFFEEYYNNYQKYNVDDRVYTKKRALDSVIKARGLSVQDAELVLSRNLRCIGEDQYKLSWDRRLRSPAPQNYPLEYYYKLFTSNSPPTLHIEFTLTVGYAPSRTMVKKLLEDMKNNLENFILVDVEGHHDLHLTEPARISECIVDFMKTDFTKLKSKL